MDPKRNESSIRERSASAVALACVLSLLSSSKLVAQQVTAKRFDDNPLITPELDPRIGTNVNGPSVIRVPEWVEGALGTYYMYFAAHRGRYIRLAYADSVEGPWRVYAPGALRIEDSLFPVSLEQIDPQIRSPAFRGKRKQPHIASPDVLVRPDLGKIVMYFHGSGVERQFTRAALSSDGIHFEVLEPRLSPPYLRSIRVPG